MTHIYIPREDGTRQYIHPDHIVEARVLPEGTLETQITITLSVQEPGIDRGSLVPYSFTLTGKEAELVEKALYKGRANWSAADPRPEHMPRSAGRTS